jgi:hypothetical protein
MLLYMPCPGGGMVDARDLKSLEDFFVRVRVPPRAPASIAQLVEQLPLKEMVVGSNPTGGTKITF